MITSSDAICVPNSQNRTYQQPKRILRASIPVILLFSLWNTINFGALLPTLDEFGLKDQTSGILSDQAVNIGKAVPVTELRKSISAEDLVDVRLCLLLCLRVVEHGQDHMQSGHYGLMTLSEHRSRHSVLHSRYLNHLSIRSDMFSPT